MPDLITQLMRSDYETFSRRRNSLRRWIKFMIYGRAFVWGCDPRFEPEWYAKMFARLEELGEEPWQI